MLAREIRRARARDRAAVRTRRPAWSHTSRKGEAPPARYSMTAGGSSGASSASAVVMTSLPVQTAFAAHEFNTNSADFALRCTGSRLHDDTRPPTMLIKIGFDIAYTAPQPTPMVVMLSVHPSRVADLVAPENIVCDPPAPIHYYHDSFGNLCGRLVIPPRPAGAEQPRTVRDSGLPDVVMPDAQQIPVENLPDEVILFLLAQPLLRNRPHDGSGLEPVQGHADWAGGGCRRSATTCIVTSPSAINSPRRPRARTTCTPNGAACAAISRIWR